MGLLLDIGQVSRKQGWAVLSMGILLYITMKYVSSPFFFSIYMHFTNIANLNLTDGWYNVIRAEPRAYIHVLQYYRIILNILLKIVF